MEKQHRYILLCIIAFLAFSLVAIVSAVLFTYHSIDKETHEILNGYTDDPATVCLFVTQKEGSQATARLFVKRNGRWHFERKTKAHIGFNGVGKEREGDKRTPLGELRVTGAFGILPNPGTQLKYIEAHRQHFACDCPGSPYYNTIIDVDTLSIQHTCAGEHIVDAAPSYNYGLMTNYNAECIPGLGSNIFVHCFGTKEYTAGCIAVSERFMRHLVQIADSNTIIYIR